LTSKNNLRVQMTAGDEVNNFPITGSPVCLAACDDVLLCIVKRESGSTPDLFSQEESASKDAPSENISPEGSPPELCLNYVLYNVATKQQLATGRLPLSAGACLRWCGFSAESVALALDSAGVLWTLSLSRSSEAPQQALVAEWQSAAELEDAGRRLWPVRAEGQSLFCLEFSKGLTEPRVGSVQKLHATHYRRPQPARAEAAERGNAECKQALQEFETCAKTGDVEDALDVILNFFESHTSHRVRLLKAAHKMSEELGEEELMERLSSILQVTSGSAPSAPTAPEQAAEEVSTASAKAPDQAHANESGEQEEEGQQQAMEEDTNSKEIKEEDGVSRDSSKAQPAEATNKQEQPSSLASGLDPEVARRIAENRAKALEKKAAAEAAKAGEKRARSPSVDKAACTPPPSTALPPAVTPAASGALDPDVARRIAENRAKALERKAGLAAKAEVDFILRKRPRSPSAEVDGSGEKGLQEAPSAVRLRAC